MFNWFSRKSGAARERAAASALPREAEPASALAQPDPNEALVEWLMRRALDRGRPMSALEQQALHQIDELIAAGGIPPSLLARPPIGASTLLSMLRDDDLPTEVLTRRIAKDLALSAEVLRLSRSARFARHEGPQPADLAQSITTLGRGGVQQAVVRVLVQPMFSAHGDSVSGRVSERLWQHTEEKAIVNERLAAEQRASPLEAYVAGLAHNTGWSLAWRIVDRSAERWIDPFSLEFMHALVRRKDRLFGKLVVDWQITPALGELGAEVLRDGLETATSPMALMLAKADSLATASVTASALVKSGSTSSAGLE